MPNAILPNPTHPVVLTDSSGTQVGGMLSDPRGNNDPLNISRSPYPRTGLKISQQDTKYSDEELPFSSKAQDDFSGGRGAEKFEDDTTRIADSYRCETRFPGVVMPGTQEKYCTGLGETVIAENWFTDTGRSVFTTDSGDSSYGYGAKFTAGATAAAAAVTLMLDTRTAPGSDLLVEIWTHDAGNNEPDTLLGTVGEIENSLTQHGVYPYIVYRATGINLTSGTVYWLVVRGYGNLLYDNQVSGTGVMKLTTNGGSTWINVTPGKMFYRITTVPSNTKAKFFTYRGAQYALLNGDIYLNGDRGVCSSSTATTLDDASKAGGSAWTADEFIGAVVYIFRGTGVGQYRLISTNDTNTLTITEAWDTNPNTTSEYVIWGANKWRTLGATSILDVAVAGEFLYYTEGSVSVYNCYNNAGTFTTRSTNMATVAASKLMATYDSGSRRWTLWGADDSDSYHGMALWKLSVPPVWGLSNLFNDKGTVYNFASPWDDYVATNVTIAKGAVDDSMDITVAAGFTTGLLATKNIAALNLTQGRYFEFAIKSSVVTADTNDLYFCYCSDELAPNSYISAPNVSGRQRPADMVYEFTSPSTYTAHAGAHDGDTGTVGTLVAFLSSEFLYVGSSRPFDNVRFNLGTVNDTANTTMTAQYMSSNTGRWTAVSGLSDGTASGAVSFAQDGNVSFTAPYDWQQYTVNSQTLYWIRFIFSQNLKANVTIEETTVWLSASTVAILDLAADTWTWVRLTVSLLSRPYPDDSAITSIGIYLATDLGAQVISLRDSIYITDYLEEYRAVQTKTRITNLVPYGSTNVNPFVMAEGELFEVQTQNSDAVVKVPLEELSVLSSPDTGLGMCTNDVYLYFTMGKRIQRYHEGLLENIGPDLDNGLPDGRSGIVSDLISLPGGSIAAVVQGSEQHSVLARKSGWHETYRTPIVHAYNGSNASVIGVIKIGGVGVQEIPGVATIMWVAQGNTIVKLEFPMSESEVADAYLYGSHIITSWISMGFLDVQKRFMILKLYSQLLVSSYNWINVYYQLETGELDSGWTAIAADYTFDVSPFDSSAIGTSYNVAGRRIRFKFEFFYGAAGGFDNQSKLRAWILGAILSLDVRYMYTIKVRLDNHQIDLNGNQDNTYVAATTLATLDGWVASPPDVLTMTSMFDTMTSKTVIILPFPIKPYNSDPESGEEGVYADIQVLEVA